MSVIVLYTNALHVFHCYEYFIYKVVAFLQNKHFPFIYCVENLAHQGRREEWESCYEKVGLNSSTVNDCYRSERGKQVSFFCCCNIIFELCCIHR